MLKRLFGGATVLLVVALCMSALVSCSSGKGDWNGSFYLRKNDTKTFVFIFTREKSDKKLVVKRVDIAPYGTVTVGGGYAELTSDNIAESRDFRFTLRGNTLSVKALSDVFGSEYEGRYERGDMIDY